LPSYWAEWCEEFKNSLPRYQVTLRVAPDFVPALSRIYGEGIYSLIEQAGQSNGDQGSGTDPRSLIPDPYRESWPTLTLTFESPEAACAQVLGLGTGVRIVEPQELQDSVIEAAGRVLAFY